MPRNTPTILPNKLLNSSAVIGGTFQKRKKLNSKKNMKKRKLFMKQNKTTLIKLKSTKKESKNSMKTLTNKKKRS